MCKKCSHCKYPLKAKIYTFVTKSDGKKRKYRKADRIHGYANNKIPDPKTVSIINVYVNGVLQPANLYKIREDVIKLLSTDIPAQGVPIIVQSIRFYQ